MAEQENNMTTGRLATRSQSGGFGLHGWTLIGFQACMFWLAAGAVAHGLNIILPALSQHYQLNYSEMLALATPASWASILSGPVCAWLCEKKGPKFNIILCLVACGFCFGLLGYCDSLAAFTLLFAGVCFFGTGFAYVGGTSLMASWFVQKVGMALGWCSVGQTFSSAFFVPVLAGLFAWLGIEQGFWGISVLMLVMAVLVRVFITNRPEEKGLAPDNQPLSARHSPMSASPHNAVSLPGIRQLLLMRDVWFMGVATGGIYIMLIGVVSQIVPRLMEMGYTQTTAIFYMSLSALFGTFGAFGWGWLNQRIGVKAALLVYTIWWIVAIIVNLHAHHPAVLWVSLLMIGLSLPGATNLSTALIATKFPRHLYVRAIGIVHPIQSVVRCFAFSILAFGLSHLGGYAGAYTLLIGTGVVSCMLIGLINIKPMSE